jgi:hypothetical protein
MSNPIAVYVHPYAGTNSAFAGFEICEVLKIANKTAKVLSLCFILVFFRIVKKGIVLNIFRCLDLFHL